MRIIFKTPKPEGIIPEVHQGGIESNISIICPASNWTGTSGIPIKNLTSDQLLIAMEELAQKSVPTGLKYKIVENSDIPSDRSFRNAWDVDEAELTDGVGT